MKNLFNNLSLYLKFIIKKEKTNLLIYIVLMSAFLVGLIPVFDQILSTSSNMKAIIDTMKNPAMISMVGPVFVEDTYTTASMYSNYMFVFTAIILAIWNILFITNHNRNDEELGRLELLRTNSVGKVTNISASLIISLLVNLAIAILMVIGFSVFTNGNIPLKSSIIFSLACCGFGFLFAAISGLFSQISSTARISNTLSFILLFAMYIIRAIGDVSVDALSYISPLGLITKTQSFVKDYFWPLSMLLVEIVIVLGLTYIIASKRDLNQGLIKEKQSRAHLSPLVTGIESFTLKLIFPQIIIWSLVIFIFSAMYGSVLGDLEAYIDSSDMIKKMISLDSEFSLTEQFVSLLILIMSMISSLGAITITKRIVNEESKGLSEGILTKPVSRAKYLASYLIVGIISAVIFQLLIALGFWIVGRNFMTDIPNLGVFLVAAFNFLPAIMISIGLTIFLFGIAPKFTWLSYLYLGYSFIVVYLGRMFDFPEIVEKLSPFGLTPSYPTEELSQDVSLILINVFISLCLIGFWAYRKRDIDS